MKKAWKALFPACLVLALFAGCGQKEAAPAEPVPEIIPALSYTESAAGGRFIEKYASTVIFSGKTLDYESGRALYHFDPAIPAEQRDECVCRTEAILSRMEETETPEMYVLAGYDSCWIQDGVWYLGAESFTCVDYAGKVVSLACGGFANYGAVWGYAAWLAQELGWERTETAELGALPDTPARDMNYLCFRESFVSPEEIGTNRAAALAFVRDTIGEKGEGAFLALLKQSGDPATVERFNAALSAWYALHGLDYSPSSILYARGTEYYDYLVWCRYARFYLCYEWRERYVPGWEEETGKSLLHESYADTRQVYETLIGQMGQVQDYLGYGEYDNGLDVTFNAYTVGSQNVSITYWPQKLIDLSTVTSFVHEYIHWATGGRYNPVSDWLVEGATEYLTNHFDTYRRDFVNEAYNDPERTGDVPFFQVLFDVIGGPIDYAVHWRQYADVSAYFNQNYTFNNTTYDKWVSFVAYLVDRYGESTVIDYVFAREFSPVSGEPVFAKLDKSLETLQEDWRGYLQDTYGAYPTYRDFE
ncbi:MAG: hypothetical protein ACI4PC_03035 [Oscillospiraceae bacterium]